MQEKCQNNSCRKRHVFPHTKQYVNSVLCINRHFAILAHRQERDVASECSLAEIMLNTRSFRQRKRACALACKKNTDETQHPQNRQMNTKSAFRIYISSAENFYIILIECWYFLPSILGERSRNIRLLQEESSIVTRDFYVTRDSFKRTILVWSHQPIPHIPIPRKAVVFHSWNGSSRFDRTRGAFRRERMRAAAALWERTRTPRVNWHLFRAIRHYEFPSQCTIDWWKKEKERGIEMEIDSIYSAVF